MTGPEHYAEAERLLEAFGQEVEVDIDDRDFYIAHLNGGHARAQVHATLALAAATALAGTGAGGAVMSGKDHKAWYDAASECRKEAKA